MFATVLVPSHSHGVTLRASVTSALRQTHAELELLIVGDGISGEGRTVALELADSDPRVRFMDNPKGDRHGEAHRHLALEAARGDAVFYLSDDDLWLPWHVEMLAPILGRADFVAATVARVMPDGSMSPLAHDLSLLQARKLFLRGKNRLPLSGAAHTLAAYRDRRQGWHPAPDDIATDLHFYNGFLANQEVIAESCSRPSVLSFPSRRRRAAASSAARLAELEPWLARMSAPDGLAEIEAEIASSWQRVAMEAGMRAQRLKLQVEDQS